MVIMKMMSFCNVPGRSVKKLRALKKAVHQYQVTTFTKRPSVHVHDHPTHIIPAATTKQQQQGAAVTASATTKISQPPAVCLNNNKEVMRRVGVVPRVVNRVAPGKKLKTLEKVLCPNPDWREELGGADDHQNTNTASATTKTAQPPAAVCNNNKEVMRRVGVVPRVVNRVAPGKKLKTLEKVLCPNPDWREELGRADADADADAAKSKERAWKDYHQTLGSLLTTRQMSWDDEERLTDLRILLHISTADYLSHLKQVPVS